MSWHHRMAAVVLAGTALTAQSSDDQVVDFSDRLTPRCELSGLTATPPAGWFNVPIDSQDDAIAGCQMMRTGEQDELLGIMRVLSVRLPDGVPEDRWFEVLVEIERQLVAQMGYSLGDVLWLRDKVPVAGPGFGDGRAAGLEASIEGNDVPQEAQFLGFGNQVTKYLLTLLTPAKSIDGGVYHRDNHQGFVSLMREGLNFRSAK